MLWLLALVPAATAALLLALRPRRRATLALASGTALAATLALAAAAAARPSTATLPAWSPALSLNAALPPLAATLALLVPAVALPVLGYAAYAEDARGRARLVALLLLFVGAMEWLVVAADLLTLLIGWELVGACSWALIAHDWREPANPRAAQFAFVTTRVGDLGLFVAAFAAHAASGSFAYADLARLDAPALQWVAAGVVVAAASKSGQLPFSPWLFRAMAGPASASALLHAATMVAAGAYLLARLAPALQPVAGFAPAVVAIGLATALAGGVVALLQPDVKKVLAASTSAHFGLMFAAVGAGFPGVAVLHLVAHGFFKALLFLAAGVAIARGGGHALARMRLGRALPGVAVAAAVGCAALAGIAPLGAAWTKDAIVAAALAARPAWGALAIVAAALSAAYAARWLWLAYGLRDDAPGGAAPPRAVVAALGALAAACALLSLLWLPAVRVAVGARLAIALPAEPDGLAAAALLAAAIGALAGRAIASRAPGLGEAGTAARIADWWRLPALIDRAVTHPVRALAEALARADDAVVDAVPRAVGRAAQRLAQRVAVLDTRAVDRGVRRTGGLVRALARFASRLGERLADGVAIGPARLVALGGDDARRVHTGMSHHAFALLVGGAAALALLLLWAGG